MAGTASQIEKAIGQIKAKSPIPEIDFTQLQLENGYTISTQERVVKEVCTSFKSHLAHCFISGALYFSGANTGDDDTHGCPILQSQRPHKTWHCISQKPLLPRGARIWGARTLHSREGHGTFESRTKFATCRRTCDRYVFASISSCDMSWPSYLYGWRGAVCGDIHGQYVSTITMTSCGWLIVNLTSLVWSYETFRNRRQPR